MYEEFVPARLTQLRQFKNVSARDMSLSIGQNKNYINQIENKKTLPSMQVFFYICEYLEITPKEFFDDGNNNPKQLAETIEHLKELDDHVSEHVAEIIKDLSAKNSRHS